MKYKYNANEAIPPDMTKRVNVELTNGQVYYSMAWNEYGVLPIASWEYAVVYDHTELKRTHVDGDWYQYSLDGMKWVDAQNPTFDRRVHYRKHPHNDHIRSYRPDDKWQHSNDGSRWRECTLKTPLWKDDLMYRKHPHSDSMREYKHGEQWQFTYVDNPDDDAWINCKDVPLWDEAASYRKKPDPKKPELEIIKLYRVPGTTVYHTSPNFELIEEIFQRIK
jgi:hypothetical protein